MGVPHLEKVTLFNIDKNKSIDMTSISGSTVHFHSSFFEDKVRIIIYGSKTYNTEIKKILIKILIFREFRQVEILLSMLYFWGEKKVLWKVVCLFIHRKVF